MAVSDPHAIFVRRILGWGVAAPLIEAGDIGRDLVLVPRPGSGRLDLGCVEGALNLGQDLAMALTMGRGTDPFDLDFGFDGLAALVEEQAPALVRELLRASVAKTVARDPRVRSVTAIEIDDGSGGATRTLNLRVGVDTIASDTASLVTTLASSVLPMSP